MVKIIMHGCNGHMGQVISQLVKDDPAVEIVAGVDVTDNRENGYPVFTDLKDCDVQADAMIDFSSFRATDGVLEYCRSRQLPLVLCTTGLTPEQVEKVQQTSREVAVLRSANMSLGINTLLKLIQDAGLRGFTVGGAQVSEKHSGFVINKGGATAEDVNRLMQEVSDRVYRAFGVRLEPEVRRIGEFRDRRDER